MTESDQLKIAMKGVFKPAGFSTKSRKWSKKIGEIIWTVGLQKSAWSKQVYINIDASTDCYVASSGKEKEVHLFNSRIEALYPIELRKSIQDKLDFNDPTGLGEKIESIVRLIKSDVLPLMVKIDSIDGMVDACRTKTLPAAYAMTALFRMLESCNNRSD